MCEKVSCVCVCVSKSCMDKLCVWASCVCVRKLYVDKLCVSKLCVCE